MKEIKVLGDVYEVEFVESEKEMKEQMGRWGKVDENEEGQVLGVCLPLSNEIKILKHLPSNSGDLTPVPDKALKKVLLHEIVHAYFEVIDPAVSADEDLVDAIATVLYHMHLDGNFGTALFDALEE